MINSLETLHEDRGTAMVKFNFLRFTENDQKISNTEVIHFLVGTDRGWQIKSVFIRGHLELR